MIFFVNAKAGEAFKTLKKGESSLSALGDALPGNTVLINELAWLKSGIAKPAWAEGT